MDRTRAAGNGNPRSYFSSQSGSVAARDKTGSIDNRLYLWRDIRVIDGGGEQNTIRSHHLLNKGIHIILCLHTSIHLVAHTPAASKTPPYGKPSDREQFPVYALLFQRIQDNLQTLICISPAPRATADSNHSHRKNLLWQINILIEDPVLFSNAQTHPRR